MDPDFGPMRKSDIERSKYSLYKTGEVPRKGYPEPNEVEWVYIETLTEGVKPQFVDDGVASSDCI
jgi:hypothetical protein